MGTEVTRVDSELYGRGVAWPLRLGSTGLAESAGLRRIEDSIRVIIGTQHGERVMRPDFGANLRSLAFAPNNAATANLARYYVQESLTRWEPRIELVEVSVENADRPPRLLITVTYRLPAADEPRVLTHPFALERPS